MKNQRSIISHKKIDTFFSYNSNNKKFFYMFLQYLISFDEIIFLVLRRSLVKVLFKDFLSSSKSFEGLKHLNSLPYLLRRQMVKLLGMRLDLPVWSSIRSGWLRRYLYTGWVLGPFTYTFSNTVNLASYLSLISLMSSSAFFGYLLPKCSQGNAMISSP